VYLGVCLGSQRGGRRARGQSRHHPARRRRGPAGRPGGTGGFELHLNSCVDHGRLADSRRRSADGAQRATRLALRAAVDMARAFPWLWLTSLAPIPDPPLVTQAASNAMGVQDLSAGWPPTPSRTIWPRSICYCSRRDQTGIGTAGGECGTRTRGGGFAGRTERSTEVRDGPSCIQDRQSLSAKVRRQTPRLVGVAVTTAVTARCCLDENPRRSRYGSARLSVQNLSKRLFANQVPAQRYLKASLRSRDNWTASGSIPG